MRSYLDQRLFVRVVELGSLRAVSRETNMEASSVSRRLSGLETRLGVKLLDRSGGTAKVTQDGERYYESLRRLLAQLDALEESLTQKPKAISGTLRVSAPPEFGRLIVSKWLRRFQQDHPAVGYHLALQSDATKMRPLPDLALTHDKMTPRFPGQCKLAELPQILVAAPSYLKAHGKPVSAMDLANHTHILSNPDHPSSVLRLTGPQGHQHIPRRPSQITLSDLEMATTACIDGTGILLAPEWIVQDHLTANRLKQVLPKHRISALSLNMAWRDTDPCPSHVSAFMQFAQAQIVDLPGLVPNIA